MSIRADSACVVRDVVTEVPVAVAQENTDISRISQSDQILVTVSIDIGKTDIYGGVVEAAEPGRK